MIDLYMFLGFPLDANLSAYLKSLKGFPLDLVEIQGPDGLFIGKKVGPTIDRETLHNVEANIYSLLQKLAPTIPFKNSSLVLFPCK